MIMATKGKQVKEAKGSSYVDVIVLNDLISNLKNKDMKMADLKAITALKRNIKNKLEEIAETEKALFESYGIKLEQETTEDGQQVSSYKWKGHKDEVVIGDKFKELRESKIELPGLNFMTFDTFHKVTKELNIAQIDFLMDYLVETENK